MGLGGKVRLKVLYLRFADDIQDEVSALSDVVENLNHIDSRHSPLGSELAH